MTSSTSPTKKEIKETLDETIYNLEIYLEYLRYLTSTGKTKLNVYEVKESIRAISEGARGLI